MKRDALSTAASRADAGTADAAGTAGTAGATDATDTARMLVARVGSEYFAFPLADVLEAVDAPVVTTVPLTPTGVLGQCTHRGQLLPVLDPHRLLGAPLDAGSGTVLIMATRLPSAVCHLPSAVFALQVDDVTDMVTVGPRNRRALPEGTDRTGMLSGLLAIDRMLVAAVEMTAFRATAATLLTTGTR